MRNLFFYIQLVSIFCISNNVNAQISDSKDLCDYIRDQHKKGDIKNASVSISLREINSGNEVVDYYSTQLMVPASVQKVITTATALEILGDTFRYRTSIQLDGTIVNGKLKGNIWIKGSGDPTLGSEKFAQTSAESFLNTVFEAIKKSGINSIDGSIIADASVFETGMVPMGWNWADLGNYYGAGASGLTYMDNTIKVFFSSGNHPGDATQITHLKPSLDNIQWINEVVSGQPNSGDNAYFFSSEYSDLRYVRGTIPPGENNFEVKASMHDPPLYCAQAVHQFLSSKGMIITNNPTTLRHLMIEDKAYHVKQRITIETIQSPSLTEIIKEINLNSNNLFAEHLFKTISMVKKGMGSIDESKKLIKKHWENKGLNIEDCQWMDGSGLSRNNIVSTSILTSILYQIRKSKSADILYSSLPIAGRTGTLKGMWNGTFLENNLRAKSGSVNLVRCYAGYFKAHSGREFSFAIMVNNSNSSSVKLKDFIQKTMLHIAQHQ
jgi:D-alanyl-D-alanine carboxypeptidase/D-alanyl-D-alanine-endopeptidase (penicillin-binding protein 4)